MQCCRKAAGLVVRRAAAQTCPALSGRAGFPQPLLAARNDRVLPSGVGAESSEKSPSWHLHQDRLSQHGRLLSPTLQPSDASSAPAALRSSWAATNGLVGADLDQRRGFFGVGDGHEESGVSRHHEEQRVIGYTPEQLYDVVAAVDLYQDFVPWCRRSAVLWRRGHEMDAELEIGFRVFNERYISHVHLDPPRRIKTTVSQSLLFDYLDNVWEFRPGPVPHSTTLHFSVAFQFRSALYRGAANLFFDEVVTRLVGAFETRCKVVYGPSRMGPGPSRKPAPLRHATHQ